MGKPIKGISLYDIMTKPQAAFEQAVLSPGDAAEIAMREDFPGVNAPDRLQHCFQHPASLRFP